jgi:hypothetical protein
LNSRFAAMARRPRLENAGAVYLVMDGGNRGENTPSPRKAVRTFCCGLGKGWRITFGAAATNCGVATIGSKHRASWGLEVGNTALRAIGLGGAADWETAESIQEHGDEG